MLAPMQNQLYESTWEEGEACFKMDAEIISDVGLKCWDAAAVVSAGY